MAKCDCKSQPTVKAKQPQPRHYTVGYVPNGGKAQPSPQLKISGRWLEELGFTPGQAVTVTTERGRMVIEAVINI
ncbi:type I toxin-antitoxin system SymE family toxin [Budviciaceae bacterium CWB-B4]|uniref:Type I toxin-antitoxin system SymE family toxin n=1 Tax=Limnobaculum xujianqingii TaxID=2738837 RepID=A0A9D7AIW5_9GAMM|nr:SymE family type I addiction module toxin [Limnobaculum xujianqingii]MBK5073442.1 type I toxin-antitoxin system SymE family toxin [Limnobaculum xujianqingii]MBK5176827.1 type I toxin-antitoxin system SymE family toxin [Limnobaculum xujianqingii]